MSRRRHALAAYRQAHDRHGWAQVRLDHTMTRDRIYFMQRAGRQVGMTADIERATAPFWRAHPPNAVAGREITADDLRRQAFRTNEETARLITEQLNRRSPLYGRFCADEERGR